jgi:hypothetical protein
VTACSCATAKTSTRLITTTRGGARRAATCATAASAGNAKVGPPPARCTAERSARASNRSRTTSCSAAERTTERRRRRRRARRARRNRFNHAFGYEVVQTEAVVQDVRASHTRSFKKAPRSTPPVTGKARSVNALHDAAPATPPGGAKRAQTSPQRGVTTAVFFVASRYPSSRGPR